MKKLKEASIALYEDRGVLKVSGSMMDFGNKVGRGFIRPLGKKKIFGDV